MDWARKYEYIIFTHDLDFGTALALSKDGKPSVIQVRTQDVTIEHLKASVLKTVASYSDLLMSGALLTIDEHKERLRILPLA